MTAVRSRQSPRQADELTRKQPHQSPRSLDIQSHCPAARRTAPCSKQARRPARPARFAVSAPQRRSQQTAPRPAAPNTASANGTFSRPAAAENRRPHLNLRPAAPVWHLLARTLFPAAFPVLRACFPPPGPAFLLLSPAHSWLCPFPYTLLCGQRRLWKQRQYPCAVIKVICDRPGRFNFKR